MNKEQQELRNDLLDEMDDLLALAKKEKRHFKGAETKRIEAIKSEIAEIDRNAQLEQNKEDRMVITKGDKVHMNEKELREMHEKEERLFVDAIREGRAVGLGVTGNGSIIPTSVADKVWNKIVQISPIVKLATHYAVKEQLQLPTHDFSTSYTVAFATEFSALTPNATAFTSVTLKNQIIGVLTKVGKSLVNMSGVDILSIVINELAMALALFIEKEILQNSNAKFTETLKAVSQSMTTKTTLVIGVEEVVQLMNLVPAQAMSNGSFIMHQTTFSYLMQQKDSQGRLLFNLDSALISGFGNIPTLMGKPVFFSDNADPIGVGKAQMYFGDFSSLVIKDGQNMTFQVANELYMAEYAVGIAGFLEMDVAIPNKQQIAVMMGK